MNAGDLMYICHYYNLEVTKTTIIRFSARLVAYLIGQLVAFKRGRFYLCNRFTITKVCDYAVLQGNHGNVKSFCKSLLLETVRLLTLANQEVREMDPEIGRVMVPQCIERQLVSSRFEYLQH